MSHDVNGTPLKVGDHVVVEYVIDSISSTPDFCNVTARSVHGRKPDGNVEHFSGNSAVLTLLFRPKAVGDGRPSASAASAAKA